jgi:hypothetical protein
MTNTLAYFVPLLVTKKLFTIEFSAWKSKLKCFSLADKQTPWLILFPPLVTKNFDIDITACKSKLERFSLADKQTL